MTGHYIVELEQTRIFPNQSFFVKRVGNPSDTTNTKDYAGPDSSPDDKPRRSWGHGVETTIIEAISWQSVYATGLLTLTIKDAPPGAAAYSWLPLEVLVDIIWLLKSHLNIKSSSFDLIEQQEASQDDPFATITMVLGSGHSQQSYQPSKSSGQHATEAAADPADSFVSRLYSGSGSGNGNPQQHLHTLGLDCFIHPCRGVCQFRPSSDSREPSERPLDSGKSSCPHLVNGHCFRCMGHFDPVYITYPMNADADYTTDAADQLNYNVNFLSNAVGVSTINELILPQSLPEEVGICDTLGQLTSLFETSETHQTTIESSQLGQSSSHLYHTVTEQALSDHKLKFHSGQLSCEKTVIGKNGQQQLCGKVCKSYKALWEHKKRAHTGPQTCDGIVVSEDGQQPCGMVCKNAQALVEHKRKFHSGQRPTCEATVVGKDGQQHSCGKVFNNSRALWDHKRRAHTGPQACNETVVGGDGQQQPCGKVCKNTQALFDHKRLFHNKHQPTCEATLVGENGQQQSCGKVCKNNRALWHHKRIAHSGPQTCDLTVVRENGQQQPCGKVCKNAQALSLHKRKSHSRHKSNAHCEQQTCNATLVGEDGQLQPCRQLCNSATALSKHKRRHRKRKPVDVDQDNHLSRN
ncbi:MULTISPECIES: hypothetical protein [unclassified Endozoicomonas]|uniref:hypothetical protein n=2 Tax=Endozoicomonas TaxID=305899 RepID=UPI0021487B39|nr:MULTISPECIES: hypothetical protein [unclassified Endozoicomonas]